MQSHCFYSVCISNSDFCIKMTEKKEVRCFYYFYLAKVNQILSLYGKYPHLGSDLAKISLIVVS